MNIRKCKNCALKDPNVNVCMLTKWEIDPEIDNCPQYINHFESCRICGAKGPAKAFIYVDAYEDFVCPNCYEKIYTCEMCGAASVCAFLDDQSGVPKAVPRQVRQGNMIITTEIRNPALEEKTCKAGCPCYNIEYGCQRAEGCCANYQERSFV